MAQQNPVMREALTRYFAETDHGLAAAYLFGSYGRGEARPHSDVDLGLLFLEPPSAALAGPADRIEADLEHRLGRRVSAIALNSAPVDLIHRVLRDGLLVYEADPSARIRFEVAARREYLDLLPVLRLYRRVEASAS